MKNLMKHLCALQVILLIAFLIVFSGCKKEKGTAPAVVSLAAANITASTATSGGSIINDGSIPVSSFGVCWSTVPNPTIVDNKTVDGSGIGKYISSITGLAPGTTYFLRSYATNAAGTSYGNEESFITNQSGSTVQDIDGNIYGIVTIGSQVWMNQNLRTTRFSNGDPIPTQAPALSGVQLNSYDSYQWPASGKDSWSARYGRLYTWYAATDSRKICPDGWHVPSDSEWRILSDYLINSGQGYGGSGNLVGKSLAAATDWAVSGLKGSVGFDISANNSSGFEGLPAGYRMFLSGEFYGTGIVTYWWSSTPQEGDWLAWERELYYPEGTLIEVFGDKSIGISIRCLKD
jgi:uncharacterized protein (TIGR02145 family)